MSESVSGRSSGALSESVSRHNDRTFVERASGSSAHASRSPGDTAADESQIRPVIGRFAPSPTGRMHVGNAYVALAAWLAARAAHGRIRLRIEDIDVERNRPDADRWIMDDLSWLGLDWDGDVVYQSQRIDCYDEALQRLQSQWLCDENDETPSAAGKQPLVYPCFCTRADLKAASAPNAGDGFRVYAGTCRRIPSARRRLRVAAGDRYALRVAVPQDCHDSCAKVDVVDSVYGPQHFNLARDIGDTVIRRSDGEYAYQFAVSVDDRAMGVNHIVRGRDLLPSTAIQQWIKQHLGTGDGASSTPVSTEYLHLPLIVDAGGRRLAKRHADLDLGALRERHVEPELVIGWCAYWLGLIDCPYPCQAADLIAKFSTARLNRHHEDIHLHSQSLQAMGMSWEQGRSLLG
ncbi:glutamate--tRNA ligase family protein [Bifidobacterium aquikefiricola]|uniref:Glutamate--tRNA ligase family protein n=1 Tax=Bifidobacterium aquikefiricola TaxID=3059038 RepID=A0AB39U677_9BIFI